MKKVLTILLALLMTFSLVACSSDSGNDNSSNNSNNTANESNNATETIAIKLPHIYAEGHPLTDTLASFFATELESRSDGRLKVDLYPNSTLATEEQIYEGLRNGTYEMGIVGTIFQDRIPSVAAFQLPFLFEDFTQAHAALYENDYGYQLIGDVASLGFTVNGIVPDGFRVMTLNEKIEDISGFSGFKLRMPNLEQMVKIGEYLGCSVNPMAMTEVYSALEQHVIDGQENPPSTIRSSGWYEIQDYLLVSNHVFTSLFICVNSDFYNSLDAELQTILDEVIDETSAMIWDKAEQQAQDDLDFMAEEADIEVYYPSDEFRAQMVEATSPMYDEMYEITPEIEEVITAIRDL